MKKLLACLATVLVSTGAMAGTKPVNLSLTPDIAICDRSETIEGLTLSIWGENEQTSLALGIANGSVGQSAGLSAGVLNYADNYKGLQWALVNYTKEDFSGWQGGPLFGLIFSVVNYTGGNMKGLQVGGVNYAGRLTGLQLGVVNYAEAADAGVQIGLVNIIHQNTMWFSGLPDELAPGMVLVNWRF
ncbi:MAG: hypothetical protein A3K18_12775 [Lentisphaerae bacterium RIFOXYA12_64_32]|nr:MAG: hypothetical protein A3K18_12775 [Lentisphaerae bacterium RIFOXYA12_64_32]